MHRRTLMLCGVLALVGAGGMLVRADEAVTRNGVRTADDLAHPLAGAIRPLGEMNRILADLITRAEEDTLTEDVLQERLRQVDRLQREALGTFGEIHGKSFSFWCEEFCAIERNATTARIFGSLGFSNDSIAGPLGFAKTSKELIEECVLDEVQRDEPYRRPFASASPSPTPTTTTPIPPTATLSPDATATEDEPTPTPTPEETVAPGPTSTPRPCGDDDGLCADTCPDSLVCLADGSTCACVAPAQGCGLDAEAGTCAGLCPRVGELCLHFASTGCGCAPPALRCENFGDFTGPCTSGLCSRPDERCVPDGSSCRCEIPAATPTDASGTPTPPPPTATSTASATPIPSATPACSVGDFAAVHDKTFSAATTSCNDLNFFRILSQDVCPFFSPDFGAHGMLAFVLRAGTTNVAEADGVFVDQQPDNHCVLTLTLGPPPSIAVSCSNGTNGCTGQFVGPS